jgi:cytochrome c biogenesis protein CcmG/thiol:disulfide interchange protein DsbE
MGDQGSQRLPQSAGKSHGFWSLAISLSLCLCLNLWVPNASALALGDSAPNFSLPRLMQGDDGRLTLPAPMVDLKEFSGTVVYLFFWDTFCAPCRDALPEMVSLRNRYSRDDLEIIAINTDTDPRSALPLIVSLGAEFLVVSDTATAVAAQYEVEELPFGLIVDRNGILHSKHLGYVKNDWIRIEQRLESLMFRTGED